MTSYNLSIGSDEGHIYGCISTDRRVLLNFLNQHYDPGVMVNMVEHDGPMFHTIYSYEDVLATLQAPGP